MTGIHHKVHQVEVLVGLECRRNQREKLPRRVQYKTTKNQQNMVNFTCTCVCTHTHTQIISNMDEVGIPMLMKIVSIHDGIMVTKGPYLYNTSIT